MSTVAEACGAGGRKPVFICDFSPPRGADLGFVDQAKHLSTDFVCVAYGPGKSVRVDSAAAAHEIKQRSGKDVVFNLATRDMNKLALQSHLLGAQVLGLENVLVVQGDRFNEKDLAAVKDVNDFRPTEFIRAIKSMNQGLDYKGLKLRTPTQFCVGASVDLGKGVVTEAALAVKKVEAGADFLTTQPIFDPANATEFRDTYGSLARKDIPVPVFFGLQVLQKDGVIFANVPEGIKSDLERGRQGSDIAVELLHSFVENGIRTIYIVPPIMKGGLRDYEAAQRVLEVAAAL